MSKILVQADPFPVRSDCFFTERAVLPCSWISSTPASQVGPTVLEFRLEFKLAADERIIVHVSADQQYLLWVDGKLEGRGGEMKSPENWFFESYELVLGGGEHCLEAFVWNYGNLSPDNRMSITPGFILIPDAQHTALLGTGRAAWKVKSTDGLFFQPVRKDLGAYITVPPCEVRDCEEFFCDGSNAEWTDARIVGPGINGSVRKDSQVHCLVPSTIEKLFRQDVHPGEVVFLSDSATPSGFISASASIAGECEMWNSDLNRQAIIVERGSTRRVIFRLDDYYCGYAHLRVRGGRGAKIRVSWAEAAFTDPVIASKTDRQSVEGKYFRGVWDEFVLDGEARELTTLAWRSGRLVELLITTGDVEVAIESFHIQETRYPLEPEADFLCDRKDVNSIIPLCFRTLQASAHEHFVDCPYYEQLPYTGDGRLEALVSLVSSSDDTLVKNMLTVFGGSADLSGFTMAAWPRTVRAVIPSFSLSWIGMIYDYALWRRDPVLVTSLMPNVRFLLDRVLSFRRADGFVGGVDTAWNFIDWADEWEQQECYHVPPGLDDGINTTYNWYFVYILGLAKRLEDHIGDSAMSTRWETIASEISTGLKERFWNAERGLFREDASGDHYSQHSQVLAILSGRLEARYLERLKTPLFTEKNLAVCSIYYRHYLFEAFRTLRTPEKILSGFELWNGFIARGFKTAPETPENKTFNQRSDCHGWGAHPFYHMIASLAGIRPASMGFEQVVIEPNLGGLTTVSATCVHPEGLVEAQYQLEEGTLQCRITLPGNLTGVFRNGDFQRELHSGEQVFSINYIP